MVTIERFVAVWCPLQRLKSTKTLLSISIIGSLVYNIPRFLEFESTTITTYDSQPLSQPPFNQTQYYTHVPANRSISVSQVRKFVLLRTKVFLEVPNLIGSL